jgi:glycosyltransferase involved in cell wall biosynthesis
VNSDALCEHLSRAIADYDRVVIGPYLFGLCLNAAKIAPDKTVLVPCLHDEPFADLAVVRECFDHSRSMMFNSHAERQLATRRFGKRYEDMPVIGMGIKPFETDPRAFARSRNLDSPYLLYCGRREPLKGTPLLLDYVDAFRARTQRDLKLVLTGTGPIEPSSALRPHLIDLGFVSEAQKHEVMAGALAFCHPSVNESFGIVALEAWLAGTPLLAHASGDVLRELCRISNGGLWFKTYGQFEETVIGLMDHPEFRNQLGAAGRRYVMDNHQPAQVAARMVEALRQ